MTAAEVLSLGADRAQDDPDGPTLDEIRGWPATIAVPRACSALGISPSWGYQLIAQGEFPVRTLQIRGRTRVITASLIAVLEGGVA